MNESRMSPAYDKDVEQFWQFAFERSRTDGDEIFLSLYKLFEQEIADTGRHMEASVV